MEKEAGVECSNNSGEKRLPVFVMVMGEEESSKLSTPRRFSTLMRSKE